ncbi:hypothetical protein D3C72_1027080 [compost metagenome]
MAPRSIRSPIEKGAHDSDIVHSGHCPRPQANRLKRGLNLGFQLVELSELSSVRGVAFDGNFARNEQFEVLDQAVVVDALAGPRHDPFCCVVLEIADSLLDDGAQQAMTEAVTQPLHLVHLLVYIGGSE